MPNLKKQIMDLKWLLERSSDIVTSSQLDRIKDTLSKAYDDDSDNYDGMEGMSTFDPNDMGGDEDDAASAFLDQHDSPAPTAGGGARIPAPKKSKSDEKDGLHQIHHDEDYRNTLQGYAKDYLKGEYSKIIRDAEASTNPGKATTGHAYHLANPQHGHGLMKEIEDVQNDPSFKDLSPREQHYKMAQAQSDHFANNPNHKDEFVASGRERNEYANAAKQVRADKRKGEQEDIGRGGTTITNEMSGASNEKTGQIIGGAATEQGTQANIGQTPEARTSGSNRTAEQVYRKETEKKKLMDMMSHNAEHGADDPSHAKRQDRMKGIMPSSDDAQSLIDQTADKMKDKREQSTQAALSSGGQNAVPRNHPKEKLAGEYMPKMTSMANKMLKQYGSVASHLGPEDLSRQGSQGLWEAVRDFDPKVHNFKGLAARRIKARMKDELNQQVNVSKPTQQDVKHLENAQRILTEQEKTKEGDK